MHTAIMVGTRTPATDQMKSKPGAGEHGRHQIWAQAALQVCIAYVGWFYVHSGFNLLQSVGYVVISGHKTDDTRRNKRL